MSSSLTCGACYFFFYRNKVFKYFSTSFPCKVKLSFYPNNYLSFTEAFDVIGADRWRDACKHVAKVIEQTKANDHFIDKHEDSFFINLADDSSTEESGDDYDSSTETVSEGE